MSIWDKIRQLFTGKPQEGLHPNVVDMEMPKPGIVSNPKEGTRNAPSSKSKTMINTITLSSDLSELYLIDSGRAIAFSLDTKAGVILGLLNGQLAVVSGIKAPIFEEAPDLPTPGDGPVTAAIKSVDIIERPIRLILAKNRQYTVTFHEASTTVSIIGVTDIDSSFKMTKAADISAFVHPFHIKDKTLTIRRVGNALEVIPSDK